VYKGYDTQSKDYVACKFSCLLKIPKRGENPLKEISILTYLHSSHCSLGKEYIIRLRDTFCAKLNGFPYYCTIMEYAYGDLLSIRNAHPMSLRKVHRYFVMIAKGLSFLHKNGISHLDISLENILITGEDEIRIIDFGQAEKQRKIQGSHFLKGKLKYMSPEAFSDQFFDGFKSDVWSLGVILWALITGSLVYKQPSLDDRRFKYLVSSGGVKLLLQKNGVFGLPSPVVHLLSKLLEPDVNRRYLIDDVLRHPWLSVNTSIPSSVSTKLPFKPSRSRRSKTESQMTKVRLTKSRTCV